MNHYKTEVQDPNRDLDQQSSPTSLSRQPDLVCMADIQPTKIDWLWPNRIPVGRLSLLVGRPGAGKSFLTCDLAARISKGEPWPDGSKNVEGSVMFITTEDDPNDTIRPRLDAHNANVSKVHLLRGINVLKGPNTEPDESAFTLKDVDQLAEAVRQVKDCRLVVIDPVGSFIGKGTDSHRDNEVRSLLTPVIKIAESHGIAVLVVMHRRKSEAMFADDTAMGSTAFTGLARAVWHLSSDPDDPARRLLVPGKCNQSAQPTGMAFTIEGDPVRLEWDPDPVQVTADDALSREGNGSGGHSAVDEAIDWLRTALSDGPRPSKELEEEARKNEISGKTLERAKKEIGVESRPGGYHKPWISMLPEDDVGQSPSNPPVSANM